MDVELSYTPTILSIISIQDWKVSGGSLASLARILGS